MTQEDKELLLKDLCARLPYDVKVQYYDNETKKLEAGAIVSCTIPIDETNQKYPTFITIRDLLIIQGNTIEDIKPYLFPLSSMTEEQKRELLELTGYEARCEEFGGFDSWGFYVNIVGEYKYEDGKQSIILYPDDIGIDWLNKNHFDYRGLIEKGLAIDATGKNVY